MRARFKKWRNAFTRWLSLCNAELRTLGFHGPDWPKSRRRDCFLRMRTSEAHVPQVGIHEATALASGSFQIGGFRPGSLSIWKSLGIERCVRRISAKDRSGSASPDCLPAGPPIDSWPPCRKIFSAIRPAEKQLPPLLISMTTLLAALLWLPILLSVPSRTSCAKTSASTGMHRGSRRWDG